MKNKKYSKSLLLVSALLTVLTVAVFIFFEGNTYASFTLKNLTFNLFVKAIVCALLMASVTTLYFLARFKKKGFYLGLYTALSALISSVVAFDLCVLCRAPLGNLTFAVILFSVATTYVTAVTFAGNYAKKTSRKNKKEEDSTSYDNAVAKTRKAFGAVFVVVVLTLVTGAIISFVFSAFSLALCAAPAILSVAYSFALFLSFGGRLYADKI